MGPEQGTEAPGRRHDAPAPGATPRATSGASRAPAARAAETSAEHPWPLRLLTHHIGTYVARMPSLWVEAQITQLTARPGSRLAFLELRDADTEASMSATATVDVLRAAGPGVREGARVVLRVQPRFYPKRGTLSLWVQYLRPVGEGELLARLEELKRLLAAEGLFDAQRKRPLPWLPRAVGLVCGRGSAAERDVVENACRRWPAMDIRVREVAVQGPDAVAQVSEAVRALDADPVVDVIVVARGGGSTEDLLPFSNEALVRVVAACRTPVVSAIGHEVDTPLLDLVADVRASTPTDAARRVVPDAHAEARELAAVHGRLRAAVRQRVGQERRRLDELRARPALADLAQLFHQRAERLRDVRTRLRTAVGGTLRRQGDATAAALAHLRALSPQSTLARGYAIVRLDTDGSPGAVLRDAAQAPPGAGLLVALAHGGLLADVTATLEAGVAIETAAETTAETVIETATQTTAEPRDRTER